MIRPRNTFVLIRHVDKSEQQIGKIKIPDTIDELYGEGEVVSVGPGNIAADGGRSDTFDLQTGQRVYLKRKHRVNPSHPPVSIGLRFVQEGEVLYLYEQNSIIGIIADPDNSRQSVVTAAAADKTIIHA